MTCNDCIHGELCMSKTDTTSFTKTEYRDLDNVEEICEDFKNKADYVEVVRCGECERRSKGADLTNTIYCPWLKKQFNKTDYCSYGERSDT